jgi:Protein of unknown function (DUF4089)
MTPADIEALVTATARALRLPLAAEHRPGVITFVGLAASMAERVMSAPLTPEDESGSVFVPIAPRGPQP